MNKTAIKNYATWARDNLIKAVKQKAYQYEITKDNITDANADVVSGKPLTKDEKDQRRQLIDQINRKGFDQVMEEVAYTWFNRFIALRFMEVNGYLPTKTRVFTDEAGDFKPEIIRAALEVDLPLDKNKVVDLIDQQKNEDLYKMLLISQCNSLNSFLPKMFEKIEDYTELLIPDFLLRKGSVIDRLITDIPENCFNIISEDGGIEIIGWLYQYYISDKHEEVVDPLHGKVINKDEIPAATQVFTTEWIVRYLIDNSVGRYWIERNPSSNLINKLHYYVQINNSNIDGLSKIAPQDITVFDPCVGSGHFLVYAFDVLMQIYIECGYSERDAACEIVAHNLFGMDIDGRAAQLAYFAVMMKARHFDRRFFVRDIQPNIFEIKESNYAEEICLDYFCENDLILREYVDYIIDSFCDAKEYGSIISISEVDFSLIHQRFKQLRNEISIYHNYIFGEFYSLVCVAEALQRKYAVVATNPPYMNKFDAKLKSYINSKYKDYAGDLFSVFIYRNLLFCKDSGYSAMMTPNVWMFTISYETLRKHIIESGITTLVQLAKGSFFKEATVDICAFVLSVQGEKTRGSFFRLEDFNNNMEDQGYALKNGIAMEKCYYRYDVFPDEFLEIPGTPFAYWASPRSLCAFDTGRLVSDIAKPRQGLKTGDNNRFVRMWYEVEIHKSSILGGEKWYPYNKGGIYRRWYGNNDNFVNWDNDGYEIRNFYDDNGKLRSRPQNLQFMGKEGLTYTDISSSYFGIRWCPSGFLFDATGSMIFSDEQWLFYILGVLSSKVTTLYTSFFSPTVHFEVGEVSRIPIILDENHHQDVNSNVENNIIEARNDWDSYETSWDFKVNPLI